MPIASDFMSSVREDEEVTVLQGTDADVVALHEDIARLFETDAVDFKSLASAVGLDPNVDFRGADLQGLDLHDENLCDFDFSYADLQGADLRNARLECRKLFNTNLNKAKMSGVVLYYEDDKNVDIFLSERPYIRSEKVRFEKKPSGLSDSSTPPLVAPSLSSVSVMGLDEELALSPPVLLLWPMSFPEAFWQLRSALKSFDMIEPAVRQLAYEMWKNSVWSPQGALDFWLAAEKHVMILTAAAIRSGSSSAQAANALPTILSVLSWASHLKLIERFAYCIWEQTGRQSGYALDHWLAAEKQVLAVSVAIIESSSAQQAMRSLVTASQSLNPPNVLEPIRVMANAMWKQAGRAPGHALDFWIAAEKSVLTLTVAAVRASAGNEPAKIVADTFADFSPVRFLERIKDRAQTMWEEAGHQASQTLDYWLNAERQYLWSIADGEEPISEYSRKAA